MLSLWLCLAVLGICFLCDYIAHYEKRKKLSKLRTVPYLPLIGHVHKLGWKKKEFLPALEKMWKECGRDKFLLKIGQSDQVIITKPHDVETILSSYIELEKNELYENYKELTGASIITHERTVWRHVRRVLSTAFSYKFLEGHLEVFRDEVDVLLDDIERKCNNDIDIFTVFYNRALQTVCRVGMGFDFNENENFNKYIEILNLAMALVNGRIFSAWKSNSFLYYLSREGRLFKKTVKDLRDIKEKIINLKKKQLVRVINDIRIGKRSIEDVIRTTKVITFMELLLLSKNAEGDPFNNDEIISELITLTFAGHETVATAATFTAYCLATNRAIQDEVFNEQLLLTGGDINKRITMKDLYEMKYLDCVIKESMRMYGPTVFFGRKLTADTVLKDGIVLPAGANILFFPYLSHKDPEVFPDPNKFDPTRFMENHPNQYTFYPFSAGPRNCIGYKWAMIELKFWIATILRKYVLEPSKSEKPILIVELVLKSQNGVKIRCTPRVAK